MSGDRALRVAVPRDPLEPHLALPNRVLVGRLCIALASVAPFGALLCYDYAVRYEAAGCLRARLPAD